MRELSVRSPNNLVSSVDNAQAKVDVVERDLEIVLIEPTDRVEHLASNRKARSCYRRIVADHHRPIRVPAIFVRILSKCVAGRAADAKRDAGVLDASILEIQFRADSADLGTKCMRYELAKPAALVDDDVVIEQKNYFPARCRNACIVYRREVERCIERDDANASVVAKLVEQLARLRFYALVVDDDELD